jgi:integrase
VSLYRRPNTPHWWCRFQLDNREIRLSTGTRNKAQAKEFEAAARARAWRQTRLGERAPYPWEAARKRWLGEQRRRDDPSVLTILNWLDKHLKGFAVQAISREVIEELRALKAEEASEATADRHMERLRAILRKCRDDWQTVDTIPKVPMYRPQRAEPRWLTRRQFARLCRKLPRHLRLAARLAAETGLRMRSQAKLTWDRIDFDERRAWVPGYQMKARKPIGIPLSSRALRTLRALLALNPKARFVHTWNRKAVDDFNTKAFKDAVTAAGVAPLRWHDLRHTWASWHVRAGTSLQELKELGGWASYSMVLRYAHLAPDHLADAAERLSASHKNRHRKPAARKSRLTA